MIAQRILSFEFVDFEEIIQVYADTINKFPIRYSIIDLDYY